MATFRKQIGDVKWPTGRGGERSSAKWYKKQVARYWRRLAKQDPENAPRRRPTDGYD